MKLKPYVVTLSFLLANIGATSAEREYKSVDEFTSSLPANTARETINIAEGDLNGDGLSDRAILTDNGDAKTHQLYVLLQTRAGGFFVAKKTKQNDGFWQAVYLSIEKGSLFVNIEGMRPTSGASHQFKLYHGIWRLIGLRYSSVTGSTADAGVTTSGFDWNIITGDVIFKDMVVKKNNKRGKWAVVICRLEDYDFDPLFCTGR